MPDMTQLTSACLGIAVLLTAPSAIASQRVTQTTGSRVPVVRSDAPPPVQWHCGCNASPQHGPQHYMPPSDCSYSSNTSSAAYDPTSTLEIPVVVHVIMNQTGAGDLTNQAVIEQIDRLNEDYSGTTLGLGSDTGIRFRLATVDPSGQATTGITRTTNNGWFQDQSGYTSALAWDTNEYLNIFTLRPMQGALGYVRDLPQSGIVGTPDDGVVMSFQAINNPQLEMVLAHEVGHYLGLYHTFGLQGGCANTDCTTQGDLICDTNPHSQPSQFCGGASPCGVPAPEHNYMNYLAVSCMYEFTTEQIQRMRCTIQHYRPDLADVLNLGAIYCQSNPNSTGVAASISAFGALSVNTNSLGLSCEQLPQQSFGYFLNSQSPDIVPGAGGSPGMLCLGGSVGRYSSQVQNTGTGSAVAMSLDLSRIPQPNGTVAAAAGETWHFQYWYRDRVAGSPTSNFSSGVVVILQ